MLVLCLSASQIPNKRIFLLCTLPICALGGMLVAFGQDGGLAEFRKLHHELRQRMDDDIDAANDFLEVEISKSPESSDLQVLRHSLASRLASERRYQDATAQFNKLLDFQIKHLSERENQYGVWMTIQSLQEIVAQSGKDEQLQIAIDRALEAYQGLPDDQEQPWGPISQLIVLKSRHWVASDQVEEATMLVADQLEKLQEVNQSDMGSESTAQTLNRFLNSLTNADRGNDSWREEYIPVLDKACTTAMERYPASLPLQNDYAETQYRMITEWEQDDPESVEKRIDSTVKTLSVAALKNRSVNAMLRRIELHRERMASAKPVASLVGQPAPEWDIDAWANTVGVTRESFKGQVILLDFWAMWCGPCIATFPHLREWREEFGDEGFEIVGVTQYYNFDWDEEQKRASRSSEEVSPQEERETIASFLTHHQLEHPVMLTPKGSAMSGSYGVRGIPHVVLIDREGVVQFIKTGAGEEAAREIHDKIKELVSGTKPE